MDEPAPRDGVGRGTPRRADDPVAGSGESGVDLVLLDRREAARIAAGSPDADDRWADGFPRPEDRWPAGRIAVEPSELGPFGVYKLVPRHHGRAVGTAGFFGPPDADGAVAIGYGMVEPERGRGHGTFAVATLVQTCRESGEVTIVTAETHDVNVASRRVLEKNGFQLVGADGTLVLYALDLADPGS